MTTDQTPRTDDSAIDRLVAEQLTWHAPPELTARLMTLTYQQGAALVAQAPRVKRWVRYTIAVLVALAILVWVTPAVAAYTMISQELGILAAMAAVQGWWVVAQGWLADSVPMFESLTAMQPFVATLQQFSQLLLVALILWVIFDNWQMRRRDTRASTSSS